MKQCVLQLCVVFLMVATVWAGFCDERSASVNFSAKAIAIGGGDAVCKAGAEAVQGFNECFCDGDISAAANSIPSVVGSGSEADFATFASLFSQAAAHDVSAAADIVAQLFKSKVANEANTIQKALRYTYHQSPDSDAGEAIVVGQGKAVGSGDIDGKLVAQLLIEEGVGAKEGFVMAVADEAVKVSCDNLQQVLIDAWEFADSQPGTDDIKELFMKVADAYDCIEDCCG